MPRIVKGTRKMVDEAIASIDWARIDAMTDEDIARQVAENPDAATLPEDDDCMQPAGAGEAAIPFGVVPDVHQLRTRFHLSQAAFSKAFGVPLATLRDLEQGRTKPSGPTATLLKVIGASPHAVMAALGTTPAPAARATAKKAVGRAKAK